jgi:HEPN domain-containing protein
MSAAQAEYLGWFEKAEHDLLSIANNLASDKVPWDKVTFDAQQAAEKYLKGFLVHNSHRPPKSHDLVELLGLCRKYDLDLSALKPECQRLSDLGLASRYPDVPVDPTESDARAAVETAHRVRAVILERVPPENQ